MVQVGDLLVPKRGNSLSDFTAYKVYEVIAGTGDENLSPTVAKHGMMRIHSETTCNVLDDKGDVRFISLTYFRPFKAEMGLFGDSN